MSTVDRPDTGEICVVYDGQCPLCNSYVLHYRLKKNGFHIRLIDARDGGPIVTALRNLGFDLDEGMAISLEGRFYHGADAMNLLAILGSDTTLFNSLNRRIFGHPRLASALYPPLVWGRRLLLSILKRPLIREA